MTIGVVRPSGDASRSPRPQPEETNNPGTALSPRAPGAAAPALVRPASLVRRVPTNTSLLPEKLTELEMMLDERIRTICLVILALAVIAFAMVYLKEILIPFAIALALNYLITPLIDVISCRNSGCPLKLPRGIAIIVAFLITFGAMFALGLLLAQSVAIFAEHSDLYRERTELLLTRAFQSLEELFPGQFHFLQGDHVSNEALAKNLNAILEKVDVTELIMDLLGSAAHIAEDIIYVALFLVFMLVGDASILRKGSDDVDHTPLMTRINTQIHVYIRGKALISLGTATINASILHFVGLQLALVFGVLTFALNFIPNIGMLLSVVLPMPLVVLEPEFSTFDRAVAFLGPLLVGSIAKDVVEPLLLGHATKLQPVAVLLCILFFGTLWGILGMVMAVPLTAVTRIVLMNVHHPLCRFLAEVLGGDSHSSRKAEAPSSAEIGGDSSCGANAARVEQIPALL